MLVVNHSRGDNHYIDQEFILDIVKYLVNMRANFYEISN